MAQVKVIVHTNELVMEEVKEGGIQRMDAVMRNEQYNAWLSMSKAYGEDNLSMDIKRNTVRIYVRNNPSIHTHIELIDDKEVSFAY